MRLILAVTFILFILPAESFSQNKLSFNSRNLIGLLEGGSGSAFQLQSINGLTYKKHFVGLGAGIDYYGQRSIPLFLSLNTDLTDKPRTFFLSANAGMNFIWKKEPGLGWNVLSKEASPGLYASGGLGYKIFTKKKKDAFLINVGYSYKHLREKVEYTVFCINPPCDSQVETFNYYYRRLSILLGWQF